MNTRTKIVSAQQARSIDGVHVIGAFDPLLDLHADRLAEIRRVGQPLVVWVAESRLLPVAARLELVAALRVVDFAAPYDSPVPNAIDDRELHARWSLEFIHHVRKRALAE